MSFKPRIAIIMGSSRETRFSPVPTQWFLRHAKKREDMSFEVVDLRDHPLPFFNEVASNLHVPSKDAEVLRWQKTIDQFDGFVFVLPEYNHSLPAVLKNAIDQAYREWKHKPFTAVAYGGLGGARALEHLRTICIEMHMASTRSAVHIAGADFMAVHPNFGKKPIEDIEAHLLPSLKMALDELSWWTAALVAARTLTQVG